MADRAVLWLDEVIARYGTAEGPGRVRIPLSQAALARATARSAGTVSYYMRRLGPLVEQRDGALVVDIAALAERRTQRRPRRAQVAERLTRRFGQATADGSAIELVDGDGPPTVREMARELGLAPSSTQRHLRALEGDGQVTRDGRCLTLTTDASENPAPAPVAADVVAGLSAAVASLAETASRLTDLAHQLLVLAQPEPNPANICAPEFAREDPGLRAEVRGFAREERTQTPSSDQEKESFLSFLRVTRESSRAKIRQNSREHFRGTNSTPSSPLCPRPAAATATSPSSWTRRRRSSEGTEVGDPRRARETTPERLTSATSSKIATVYAGKGGVGKTTISYELAYLLGAVLVDLDWDAGGASGMWGYNPRERQPRTPLVDAIGTGQTPSVVCQERRPDLVPSHPDLAVNQPEPAELRDRLAKWAVEWDRPWAVVDTHPGGGAAAFGALAAASVVVMPVVLGMRELDALEGTLAELEGYPILVVPNKVTASPPVALVERLERILAAAGDVTQTDVISYYPWLARRQLRVALTSYDPIPHRLERVIEELRAVTTAVESYGQVE